MSLNSLFLCRSLCKNLKSHVDKHLLTFTFVTDEIQDDSVTLRDFQNYEDFKLSNPRKYLHGSYLAEMTENTVKIYIPHRKIDSEFIYGPSVNTFFSFLDRHCPNIRGVKLSTECKFPLSSFAEISKNLEYLQIYGISKIPKRKGSEMDLAQHIFAPFEKLKILNIINGVSLTNNPNDLNDLFAKFIIDRKEELLSLTWSVYDCTQPHSRCYFETNVLTGIKSIILSKCDIPTIQAPIGEKLLDLSIMINENRLNLLFQAKTVFTNLEFLEMLIITSDTCAHPEYTYVPRFQTIFLKSSKLKYFFYSGTIISPLLNQFNEYINSLTQKNFVLHFS